MEKDICILNQLTSFIVSKCSPKKIILFGSRARGDHYDDSDYDILLIMDDLTNSRELISYLYYELWYSNLPKNIDFLAISHDRYEDLKTNIFYVYKTIDNEGKILYGQ
jgi:predicted nucleotidyltransferase